MARGVLALGRTTVIPVFETVLLVHSPLVGPSSWRPFAELLAERGIEVLVPDLTPVTLSQGPWFDAFVGRVLSTVEAVEHPITAVGHSGAGVFLPSIGDKLGNRLGSLVFVDAVVPPESGGRRTPEEMEPFLDEKTVDGLLLPWLDWWPDDVMSELIPDPQARAELRADMPRIPRSFYDEETPTPVGWSDLPCAFIDSSGVYQPELKEARRRGWPCTSLTGTHLSIYTHPEQVFEALGSVVGEYRK